MLPIARAIVEDTKVALRAERAQAVLPSVCQVLCLLQTWASSLQHFALLVGPLSVDALAFPTLASELVQAAAQLSGAHVLNDLTVLQTADLPTTLRTKSMKTRGCYEMNWPNCRAWWLTTWFKFQACKPSGWIVLLRPYFPPCMHLSMFATATVHQIKRCKPLQMPWLKFVAWLLSSSAKSL